MADNEKRAHSRRASRRRSCLKTIVGNKQDDTTGSTNLQPRRKSKTVSFDHYRSVKIFEKDSPEKDEEDEKTEFLDKTSHAEHDMDLTRLTELSPSGDDLNETQKIQNFFKLFSDDKPTTKNGMDTTLGMPSLHSESPHVNNNKTILNNYDVMDEASETFVTFPLDRTTAEKETKISSADFLSNFKSTKDNYLQSNKPPESSLVSGKDFLAKLISHKTPSESDDPPPGAIALELNNITILSEASMNITDDENQRELMLNQLNMSAAISPSSKTKNSLEAQIQKGFSATPVSSYRDYCSTFGKSPNISNITKIALGDSPTKTISIPATQTPILVTPRRNAKETATSISNETPSLSHDKLAPNEDINSISQSQNVILVTPKRSVSKKRPETAPVSEAKSTGISLGETSAFASVPMKRIKLSNEAEPVKLPSVSTILPRLNQTSPKKNSIAPSSQWLVASSQSPQLCIPTTATLKVNPLKLLMEQKEDTNTSVQTKLSSLTKPLPINTLPGGSPPQILNTDTISSIQNKDTNPQSQFKVADEKKDPQNRRKTYTLSKDRRLTIQDVILAGNEKCIDDSTNFEQTLVFQPPIANSSMMVFPSDGLVSTENTPKAAPLSTKETTSNETFVVTETKQKPTQNHTSQSLQTPGSAENIDDQFIQSGANEVPITNKTFVVEEPSKMEKMSKTLEMNFTKETLVVEKPTKMSKTMEKTFTKETLPVDVSSLVEEQASSLVSQAIAEADLSIAKENQPTLPNEETLKNEIVQQIMSQLAVSQANTNIAESVPSQQKDEIQRMVMNMLQKYNLPTKETITPVATADQTDREPTELLMDVQAPDGMEDSEITTSMKSLQNFDFDFEVSPTLAKSSPTFENESTSPVEHPKSLGQKPSTPQNNATPTKDLTKQFDEGEQTLRRSARKITTDERLVKSFVCQTVYDAEKSVIRETADGFTKNIVETNDVVTSLVESNDVDMEKNVVVEKTLDSKEDDRNQTVDTKNQTIDDFTTPKVEKELRNPYTIHFERQSPMRRTTIILKQLPIAEEKRTSSSKKKRRKRMNMPSSRKPKTKVTKENSPPIQKKKHNFQASDGSFTVEDLDDATLLVNFPKYKHFHCLIKHQGDSLNDVIVGRNYHNTKQFKQGAQSLTAQDEWYYSCVEQSISNQKLSEKYTDMTEVSNLISELKRLFSFWQPFIMDLYEVVRRSQGEVNFTDHSLTCEMLDLVNYRGSFTFQATFDLSVEKPKPIFWLQHDTGFKIHGLEDLTNDAVLQTSFFPVYHYYKMLREFQKTRINIEFDRENAGDVKKFELPFKAYL
ncbi:mucin-3A-like [Clytia hemisphaerica]|uniref:Uncharacterized protein n=1 Tax=Clytia hemisphaerica TaxID=252671 RepID=A0A7M5WIH5_9CNID